MEIILSKNVRRLTGTLSKKHGYFIRQTTEGKFVGVRKPGLIPADGHLRFIFDIAEMTRDGFFVSDIQVQGKELYQALIEAGLDADLYPFDFEVYNAKWVLNFKKICGL